MDDKELEGLLKGGESDRVEFKPSISQRKEIQETICAFANDLPNHRDAGVVFVGVDDSGACCGIDITDSLLKNLSDMRTQGEVYPFPTMSVEKRVVSGCEVAVVVVESSYSPPVRYRGRVIVRVGPTNRIATLEEETRLTEKRQSKDTPFDISPLDMATLDDFDMELFRDYLRSTLAGEILELNSRNEQQQLASLRFTTADGIPTILGLLVVGKEPVRFVPGAYVQFLRIEGTDYADPIKDSKEIDGPASTLLRHLDDLFRVHISVASDITSGPVEVKRPDYPIDAIRQLSTNAILHRTYQGTNSPVKITWFTDRIEIISPGGPYGKVTKENFGQPGIADYRNPSLAEALKNLGFIQKFGVGIPLARQALQKNGNPDPEFHPTDTHVLVTLRRR